MKIQKIKNLLLAFALVEVVSLSQMSSLRAEDGDSQDRSQASVKPVPKDGLKEGPKKGQKNESEKKHGHHKKHKGPEPTPTAGQDTILKDNKDEMNQVKDEAQSTKEEKTSH